MVNNLEKLPGTKHRARQARCFALYVHSVFVLLCLVAYLYIGDPSDLVLTFGLMGVVAFPTMAVIEAQRTPLRLTPLSFYFAWYTVGSGIATIHMGMRFRLEEYLPFSIASVHRDDIAVGNLIFLVGQLALHAGLELTRPEPRRVADITTSGDFSHRGVVLFLAFVAVSGQTFYPAVLAQVGVSRSILDYSVQGSAVGLLLVPPIKVASGSFGMVTLAVLSTSLLLAQNIGSGSKAFLMLSFLPVVWYVGLTRRRLLAKVALFVAIGVIYFVVVEPLILYSRASQTVLSLARPSEMREMVGAVLSGEAKAMLGEDETSGRGGRFLDRMYEAVPIGFFVDVTRTSGFEAGSTLDYLRYAFIPRLFWADKPNVTRGGWFTMRLGFSQSEESATTSTGMTAVGELYWNFGIAGVIAGMFILGSTFGISMWRLATAWPLQDAVNLSIYVGLMFALINTAEAGSAFVGAVGAGVTFRLLKLALHMSSKPGSNSAGFRRIVSLRES